MNAGRLLRRVAAMSPAELRDRMTTSVRREAARLAHRARAAAWCRTDLARALVPLTPALATAIAHLHDGRAGEAHRLIVQHVATRRRRWPVTPLSRDGVVFAIGEIAPGAAADAGRRADAIAAGRFDLLGYEGLCFRPEGGEAAAIDWHLDPVHGRRAPALFWSDVPFLDPACGDHKIIWELNRHQHWLALGRAWWLTGDRRYPAAFASQLASWLAANPPLTGINWASMLELGLRAISWIWALQLFAAPGADGQDAVPDDAAHPWSVDLLLGLDRQLHLVEHNLSTWFSPNTHLIGEALALYVAGRTLPELRRAPIWAHVGRRVLLEEMVRQIAPDGGHVERSFHYHRYTLDFYLLALVVARLTGDDAQPFDEAARRLARFARAIADDRGRLARIGDDDGGQLLPIAGRDSADVSDSLALAGWLLDEPALAVGALPEEAIWMSGAEAAAAAPPDRAPLGSVSFSDSGYTICRTARGDHLVFDAGPHGFLNGGHAHADALAVTLTVAGRPLFVDAGTACYTIDPWRRDRFRSTPMHNTLTIDGRPQSEPAGPFHWACVADGRRIRWATTPRFDYVEGEHDGYAPRWHRRAVFARARCWVVVDRVTGRGAADATQHWHLDPRWTVTSADDPWVRAEDGAGPPIWIGTLGAPIDIVAAAEDGSHLGWIAPAYGRLARSTALRVESAWAPLPQVLVTIVYEGPVPPGIEQVPVQVAGAVDPLAIGIRLTDTDGSDTVVFASTAPVVERVYATAAAVLETDAAFAWHHAGAGGRTHAALVDGTFVRVDGRMLIASPRLDHVCETDAGPA